MLISCFSEQYIKSSFVHIELFKPILSHLCPLRRPFPPREIFLWLPALFCQVPNGLNLNIFPLAIGAWWCKHPAFVSLQAWTAFWRVVWCFCLHAEPCHLAFWQLIVLDLFALCFPSLFIVCSFEPVTWPMQSMNYIPYSCLFPIPRHWAEERDCLPILITLNKAFF